MLLFSTIFFVDGNPVGYNIYKEAENLLTLNPAENPNREIQPPNLRVKNMGDQWEVEGTENRDLIDQVLEEVTLNTGLHIHTFSAAP